VTIRAVTQLAPGAVPATEVTCTLTCPVEILERIQHAEEALGEQQGAIMRDRLLQALAAMVIASIDEFRMGPIFVSLDDDRRIEAERQRILKRGTPPDIGLGDEPLDFGGKVK
jgi:hypothetical protein